MEETAQAYKKLVHEGLDIGFWHKSGEFEFLFSFAEGQDEADWYHHVENISFGLYCAAPECFLPYRFRRKFDQLITICQFFNIPLPEAPTKGKKKERKEYYAQVNSSFHEFRQRYNLSPPEMCAFLYDFAVKSIQRDTDKKLPKPLKAWLLIGNRIDFKTLDGAQKDTSTHWSGNIDTRPGDICIMYCKSPRSYIHSIWRAESEGFDDPFFYYHNSVRICSPIHTKQVSFKQMKTDPFLSETSLIKSNLQGASGKNLSFEEYNTILKLMETNGQNLTSLPRLKINEFAINISIKNESDVEQQMLEPLLHKLGYHSKDWVRQLPLRMGRGERVYPDYALGVVNQKGEESAKLLIEAKYRIPSSKLLKDAYFQAKSYALRLESRIFVIVSEEGLWVFEKGKNGFLFDKSNALTWSEIVHPDSFHKLYQKIGKDIVLHK